jgi:uncharacterized protein involved in response to NO
MTIGMMTRREGHTGRAPRADGFEVAAFALVMLAAFLRVFRRARLAFGVRRDHRGVGLCWSAAFALCVRY